jgi:hypothetical protein
VNAIPRGFLSNGGKLSIQAQLLEEPDLLFGRMGRNPNPKFGLAEYGPFDVLEENSGLREIQVGIIGTGQTIEDCKAWLRRCEREIEAVDGKARQYPRFPGFNENAPFHCRLKLHQSSEQRLVASEVGSITDVQGDEDRFDKALDMLEKRISLMLEFSSPDVIVFALPDEIADTCWSLGGERLRRRRRGLTRAERVLLRIIERDRQVGQGQLFPEAFELEEDFRPIYRDFRRALKARIMRWRCPIQIGLPSTWRDSRHVQDAATRAWNFFVALYYKAGGRPWNLADIEDGTCFVGVSFYQVATEKMNYVYTSLAQVFDRRGDGIVVRGTKFDWDPSNWGRSPHLPRLAAENILRKAVQKYREISLTDPKRVVLHKSSRYWREELDGFRDAVKGISQYDLVAMYQRGTRFFREGAYPPLRGTLCQVGNYASYLYTSGYTPNLGTYPGPYVPEPIEIVEQFGDSSTQQLSREILSLTKLNWNSATFACGFPMTLFFAREVGKILSEVPEADAENIQSSYRFYV